MAQQIYNLRTKAKLTQKELAAKVGTTASVVSRLEDADYEGHSLRMLHRIAEALGRRAGSPVYPNQAGQQRSTLDFGYFAGLPGCRRLDYLSRVTRGGLRSLMHEGFLQRIRMEPDEDVHRLVYADFLDEHGDADRAEFIRLQIRLARGETPPEDMPALRHRERRLLLAHELEWTAPLHGIVQRARFVRRLRRARHVAAGILH